MRTLRIVGLGSAVVGIVRMLPLLLFVFQPISSSSGELGLQSVYWTMQALLVAAGLKVAAGKRWALYVGVLLVLLDVLFCATRGVPFDPLDFILFIGYVVALVKYQSPNPSSARSRGTAA